MASLENLPDLAWLKLLEYLPYKDKIVLRKSSKRLYLRVTNLDIKFKVWAFNPVKVMATIKGKDKTLIPEFIKDSTKPFHLYLNDVDRKDVAKVIKFIKTYINRVEGVKITLTEKDDYLLTKLAAMKPMWVNLISFIVHSKSYENTNLEIFPMLFHCQNTLQELDFAYVVIKFKKGLMFSCLKSLTVNYCENIVELIRSTSPQLEKLHITQFSNISITGNFSKLKEFKSCGPKLEWENIKEILSNCQKTIKVLDVSSCIQSHQIENLQQLKFKNLRKIKLTDFNEVYSNKIVKLMADCAPTLQILSLKNFSMDYSKLSTNIWQITEMDLCINELSIIKSLHHFLNKCPHLQTLTLFGFLMDPFSKTTIEPIKNIPLKTLIFWNCPFPFVQSILQSFHKTLKKLELDLPEDTLELLQRLDFPVLESVLVREDHFLIEDICKTFFKDKKTVVVRKSWPIIIHRGYSETE